MHPDAARTPRTGAIQRSTINPRAVALAGLRVFPLGDSAVTLVLGREMHRPTNALVHAAAAAIRGAALPWVLDVVPAYASLAVHYEPLHMDQATVLAAVEMLARAAIEGADTHPAATREHLIPVRYDGADLEAVARATRLTTGEVVALHCAPSYTVYMLGFVPGFAYLGDLHPALALERRSEPRASVPPGSVAVAGRQTAIYPLRTPGGWHILGSTELRPFDENAIPPCRFAPGDMVRFVAVDG